MRPWNPMSITFGGQPIIGCVPTGIRVLGPALTGLQLGLAQSAFSSFCARARLSVVQNVNEHGLLADGSPYQIATTNGVAQMTVITNQTPDENKVASGILFYEARLVLVNKGKANAPSAEWMVVDVRKIELDSSTGKSGPKASYNFAARLTVSRYAPMKTGPYIYSEFNLLGRYGQHFAYVDRSDGEIIGITGDYRVVFLGKAAQGLQIFRSAPINIKSVFPDYGAPQRSSYTQIHVEPAEILFEHEDVKYLTAEPRISKDGRKIAFVVGGGTPIDAAAEYDNGSATLSIPNPLFGGIDRAGNIATLVNYDDVLELRIQNEWAVVKESTVSGDHFGAAVEVFPRLTSLCHPKTKVEAYLTNRPDQLNIYINHSSVEATGISYPRIRCQSVSYSAPPSKQYTMTSGGGGPLTRTLKRDETGSGVVSLEYAGSGTLVPLVQTSSFKYRQDDSGAVSISYRGRGTYASEQPPYYVGELNRTPEETMETESSVNVSTVISLQYDSEIDLGEGRLFTSFKTRYAETSSYSMTSHEFNSYTVPSFRNYDISGETQFTLSKEQRSLLVFDPALDLLCYTEVVSTVSNSASMGQEYKKTEDTERNIKTTSGGGGFPTPPTPRLLIKCKSRTIEFELPFLEQTAIDQAANGFPGMKNQALLRLYPNTGIAPGIAPNSTTGTSDGFFDLEISTGGFPNDIHRVQLADDPPLGPAIYQASTFRGLSPSINFPQPSVRYVKTPETGGGYLTVGFENGDAPIYKRYVVDMSGIREADTVVSGLPPWNANSSLNPGAAF